MITLGHVRVADYLLSKLEMMFFKKSTKIQATVKAVSLFISDKEKQIIIAPLYKNNDGIYYEQETCASIKYPLDYSILGEEIIKNLNLFIIKDKNLRDQKTSDWPAYKASKQKTKKAFQENYLRIWIAGANESNIILVFEGASLLDSDLIIKSSLSSSANKNSIGKKAMKIYNACFGIFGEDKSDKGGITR
jgi:hypothetical protein